VEPKKRDQRGGSLDDSEGPDRGGRELVRRRGARVRRGDRLRDEAADR